ncbi:MAG TPA: hypothetical protein VH619_01830 [Verrucomicrobiae bacterium]|jgi:hypothetical protein|nr:hypothetical protein [Verrucomicrobiae bacterium]
MPKESQTAAPDLAAENATLKARIAQFETAKVQIDADEKLVLEKMTKGLRREQAVMVLQRQREFDKKNPSKVRTQAL